MTDMQQAVLQPFAQADLARLTDLWINSWNAVMPQIDFTSRRDWFAGRIAELHEAGAETICALSSSGAMLGFVTVNRATHYLDQIAVAPGVFGSSVAKQLVDEAKRLSPASLHLRVNQDNPRALRFYEREGFARIGEGVNQRSGLKIWSMTWRAP